MLRRLLHYWDITTFYLDRKVYYAGYSIAALFVLSFFVPLLESIAFFLLLALALLVVADTFLLYQKKGLTAARLLQDRFSIGDENKVVVLFHNEYPFAVTATVIDELPFQLQERKWKRALTVAGNSTAELVYAITPQERGEYRFGFINAFVRGPLNVVQRRFILGEEQTVKVYPSYIQMRRYQLLAVANRLQETGLKRLRRLGHSMEFEQIKEYVRGDDYRTINWKATARKGDLMVNNYTDERSQQIYCLINKGRVMKMPFEGMTLLDYAINASLVLSGVAVQKQDKAGLITFGQTIDAFVTADKKPTQINAILEALYKQQTAFLEPDLEKLFSAVRNRITQRSLLVLFTNFESFDSLDRVLPSLKRLAHYHLLMVVFFDNTELKVLTEKRANTTEEIYIKTIAEKYRYEKHLIVKELQQNGIIAVLSTPQNLTINALNKYLELKTRQSI
ncbi:DUF58 domain-containing protein [Flavisolibacter nicotianae]|uniref:DUF58 domain-containing protein n=1 Tax=Flavisolibacter nicotianae TaxID=2364882 RepID=UPI0013C52A02|nr:DUF58 domain-containing protein [Flavisolibacter nicotianae]